MSLGGSHDGRQPPSLERQAVALAGQIAVQMYHRFREEVPLDDLRSLALEAALKAARTFDGRGSFPKFLLQRVRWALLDELRRRQRRTNALQRAWFRRTATLIGERSADLAAATEEATEDPPPAANALAAMFRGAAAAMTLELDAAGLLAVADAEEDVEGNTERMRVRRAVAALPDAERVVVEQHSYVGETFEEIAAARGLERSTVFSRYTRAVERLRGAFEEQDPGGA